MKKTILLLLIFFLVGFGVRFTFAQEGESYWTEEKGASMEEGMSKKITLDLRGMDIVDTIKFLAMKGDLNIVTSKSVTGRTTLFLKNVTISDTLDVILLTNKLASDRKNNIITIMTEVEYEELYGEKYTDKREVKTLKLIYALPSKIGEALASIKSSIGKIIMDDATGTLILIDTPEKIIELEETAIGLDKGLVSKAPSTVTKVFELDYAIAEDIEKKVSEVLTEGIGDVRSDERTNKLIVRDLPNKIEDIEEMIAAFDAPTREVFIEVKIVEITLSDDYSLGVNWDRMFRAMNDDINLVGTFPASGITDSYGSVTMGTWKSGYYLDEGTADQTWHSGEASQGSTREIITMLREIGDVRVVSSPHIAVCNNEEAKIMVGTRQPYATSTISQSDTTATTAWSAEFVDIGVTLSVTPTINKNGFIKMHIKPEISTIKGWFEIQDESGATQIRLPEVDTSNAETDILLEDGRTIIIAGLIRDISIKGERKIPIIGDIPLIGNLFKSTSSEKSVTELVIFITPHIISGTEDIVNIKGSEKTRKPRKE